VSGTKGVPHLAGQRAAYLHLELRAYKSGARSSEMMEGAVRFLSDEALFKVAAYYASMEPAQPNFSSRRAVRPLDAVAAGKAASASCVGCHGENGVTKTPGVPSLTGLDPKYLVAAMKEYKGGQRRNDVMKSMLAQISGGSLENVALHYALQDPGRAQTPSRGDRNAGKAAAAACAGCHGEQGVSSIPATPSLAGQDAQYLANALKDYKSGSRKDETMKAVAASLDERATKDIAAYYAGEQPQAPKVRKPLTIAEWTERCDRCHGVNGNSVDPRLPALAAQRVEYLENVLQAYRSGARKSTAMAAMSGTLTERDVADLAAHYSRQKARAFVYVAVPGK
jgi:cytochrome c553